MSQEVQAVWALRGRPFGDVPPAPISRRTASFRGTGLEAWTSQFICLLFEPRARRTSSPDSGPGSFPGKTAPCSRRLGNKTGFSFQNRGLKLAHLAPAHQPRSALSRLPKSQLAAVDAGEVDFKGISPWRSRGVSPCMWAAGLAFPPESGDPHPRSCQSSAVSQLGCRGTASETPESPV